MFLSLRRLVEDLFSGVVMVILRFVRSVMCNKSHLM